MSVGKLAASAWVVWIALGLSILGMVAEAAPPIWVALPGFFLWMMAFPVGGTLVLLFILFGDR